MKQLQKLVFGIMLLSLVFFCSLALIKPAYALENYVLGDDVDYANSQGQGAIDTELLPDGSIKTVFNTTNPSAVRMYYAASGAEQYRVDLTNFTFKFTVNQLITGGSFKIAFLKSWDDYPLDQWGTGLGFVMQDDNSGAYNVLPYLYTGGVGQVNDAARNWYLVYDNATRPNHLNKTITLTTSDAGTDILIQMVYDENSGNQVSYSNLFPKSYFTERGMDPTNVLFMFGINYNNNQDFEFTINDISDPNTTTYETTVGDAANLIYNQVALVDLLDTDITVEEINTYYQLKNELSDLTNLRKADLFKKNASETTLNSIATAYETAVIDNKVELFGAYDETFEVTTENLADVEFALSIYNLNKVALNDSTLDDQMQLLLAKTVAYNYSDEIDAVELAITTYLTTYETVDASNYLAAKADYPSVLAQLNALDEQIRPFVENGTLLLDFTTQLAAGKDLFYSNVGTLWSSYDSNLHYSRSILTENGTELRLIDSFGDTRVFYGEENLDYLVSFEDLSLSFVVNSLEDLGRFAINFGEDRSMLPNAEVGKLGISLVFRSTSANAMDVALKDTATDEGCTFGTPLDMWGKYGTISGTPIEGKLITISFEKSLTNYLLTITVEEGTGFEVTIPVKFFNDRGLNPDELVLNITTGEGANHNNGQDIELTIVEVLGKQEDAYVTKTTTMNNDFAAVEALYAKIVDGTATALEVEQFNELEALLSIEGLRAADVESFETRLAAIDNTVANEKAALILQNKIALLPSTITEANYDSTKTLITEVDEYVSSLSAEQLLLVNNRTTLETVKNNVASYEDSIDNPGTTTTITTTTTTTETPTTDTPNKLNGIEIGFLVTGLTVGLGAIGFVITFIIKKSRPKI